jgi:hypothetical protein
VKLLSERPTINGGLPLLHDQRARPFLCLSKSCTDLSPHVDSKVVQSCLKSRRFIRKETPLLVVDNSWRGAGADLVPQTKAGCSSAVGTILSTKFGAWGTFGPLWDLTRSQKTDFGWGSPTIYLCMGLVSCVHTPHHRSRNALAECGFPRSSPETVGCPGQRDNRIAGSEKGGDRSEEWSAGGAILV